MNYNIYLEYMYQCDRFNYSGNSPSSHCAVSHVNQNLKAPIYKHNLLKISVSNSNIVLLLFQHNNINNKCVCVCVHVVSQGSPATSRQLIYIGRTLA